jgi:hypothetical protein
LLERRQQVTSNEAIVAYRDKWALQDLKTERTCSWYRRLWWKTQPYVSWRIQNASLYPNTRCEHDSKSKVEPNSETPQSHTIGYPTSSWLWSGVCAILVKDTAFIHGLHCDLLITYLDGHDGMDRVPDLADGGWWPL